jgi:hypothetical protein
MTNAHTTDALPVAAQSTGAIWTDDAVATDAEALRHLLASLHERLVYADDALALGAIKHITRLEAAAKIRAQYIDDAGHRFTDCEAGNCRCDYETLRVWS